MSTIFFCAEELANFAALAVKFEVIKPEQLAGLISDLGVVSGWNARAYSARYGEFAEPEETAEIERAALDMLAGRTTLRDYFGPFLYNCDGLDDNKAVSLRIQIIENELRKRIEADKAKKQRESENAKAFEVVGKLPQLTRAEIAARCVAAGCERIIEADFFVDESDLYQDYHGGRCARSVVIGFGKGKRESFPQLRKAAALFPPTVDFGPGCNLFTVLVRHSGDSKDGQYSHWHSSDGHGETFTTREKAQRFIDLQLNSRPYPLNPVHDSKTGEVFNFAYAISEQSIEHRENYSMGGGNYLGYGRYNGWRIKSTPVSWFSDDRLVEFFDANSPMIQNDLKD